MTGMVERIEAALRAVVEDDTIAARQIIGNRSDLLARAVLEALREPTPEMVSAGINSLLPLDGDVVDEATAVWDAMIDAALSPQV